MPAPAAVSASILSPISAFGLHPGPCLPLRVSLSCVPLRLCASNSPSRCVRRFPAFLVLSLFFRLSVSREGEEPGRLNSMAVTFHVPRHPVTFPCRCRQANPPPFFPSPDGCLDPTPLDNSIGYIGVSFYLTVIKISHMTIFLDDWHHFPPQTSILLSYINKLSQLSRNKQRATQRNIYSSCYEIKGIQGVF